jgi:hypothetical protein
VNKIFEAAGLDAAFLKVRLGEGGGGAREESTQHGALTSLLFVKAGCVRFDEQERKGGAAAWWDASFSGYACVWSVQCERQRAV